MQVRQENLRLQRQVEVLQGQLTHYQEAYLQQQRLRELLGFRCADLSAGGGGRGRQYRSQFVVRSGYN